VDVLNENVVVALLDDRERGGGADVAADLNGGGVRAAAGGVDGAVGDVDGVVAGVGS
jgi:hypothetical protein